MAVIKVACPRCGQKVSGDETFFGISVDCPICTSVIHFPGAMEQVLPRAEDLAAVTKSSDQGVSPGSVDAKGRSEGASPLVSGADGVSSLPGVGINTSPDRVSGTADSLKPTTQESWPVEREELPSPLLGAVSLVSAVLSIVTCVGGVLFAPLAIITGHVALARAKDYNVAMVPGKTLARLGVILGYAALCATIALLIALMAFADTFRAQWEQWYG